MTFSPPERDRQAQDKDARSVNSIAIDATEDDVLCRLARSGGRDLVSQQPSNVDDTHGTHDAAAPVHGARAARPTLEELKERKAKSRRQPRATARS